MTDARSGPVPSWLGRLTAPAYALAIGSRNRKFDRGEGVERVAVPVISVGNLSVGGTGKTPMVVHLVTELLHAGLRPSIAMRGYVRGRSSDGAGSDEARMYRALLPEVPVVARPDRANGIRELLADGPPIDCVVLDDGFQHRRLARDFDIVLIDASRNPFGDHLLPRGWLREPTESLRRADQVVLTHAELSDREHLDDLAEKLSSVCGCNPSAIARHIWTALRIEDPARPGEPLETDVGWLRGKRVLAVCAIGNPDAFLDAAARRCEIVDREVLPDHHPYGEATVRGLMERAGAGGVDAILTTDKDWTKLAGGGGGGGGGGGRRGVGLGDWPVPVVRPVLAMSFDRGREALTASVLRAIRTPRGDLGARARSTVPA